MGLRYLSVCSGIEAASIWADLGWQCAGLSEIEPFPRAVLEQRLDAEAVDWDHRHQPGSNVFPLFGDFTKIEAHHVGPIDLLVGGTPCQSFSIAGKRLGLDDPRGNLTLEFLALAKRLRPRWIVWENVPGILSHDDGRTFGTFLGLLAECGFERWAYRVLDAQYVRVGRFGRAVPQRRRRVFVVGYSGTAPVHPRAVLFDRESLRGDPAPRREAGEGIAADVAPSLTSSGRGVERAGDTRGQDPVIAAQVASTLNAAFGSKQGLEDQHVNSGCPLFVAHALRGEGFDASEDGTGRGTALVPVPFDTTQITSAGNYSQPKAGDPCHPLAAGAHPPAIAFDCKGTEVQFSTDGSHPTLRSMGHSNSHQNAGGHAAIAHRWGIRRLTPTECERLQGFPDGWTQIEWRGKPAEQCPDGPRYKASGNSMARNVMLWLGERIDAVDGSASHERAAA